MKALERVSVRHNSLLKIPGRFVRPPTARSPSLVATLLLKALPPLLSAPPCPTTLGSSYLRLVRCKSAVGPIYYRYRYIIHVGPISIQIFGLEPHEMLSAGRVTGTRENWVFEGMRAVHASRRRRRRGEYSVQRRLESGFCIPPRCFLKIAAGGVPRWHAVCAAIHPIGL
jgi:hypothetical protein